MSISILKEIIIIQELSLLSATNNNTRCILKLANIYPKEIQTVRRVEKFKNSRGNIFRMGKYVHVLGGLIKVV